MKNQQQNYVLTEEEIAKLFELSLDKYKTVLSNCNPIYRHLVEELRISNEAKQLFNDTSTRIVNEKNSQKEDVLRNELERSGFQVSDPYYIACMKPLAPLIYKAFFTKGQKSNDIKQRYEIKAINQGFQDMGGNAASRFKRKFYSQGTKYYKKLKAEGILKKFPNKKVPKGGANNGFIPESWIRDYLDKMRTTAKQKDYTHLIEAR